MAKVTYSKIRGLLPPYALAWVLSDSLDKPQCIKLLQLLDITFPGVRTQSLQKNELIEAIINECERDPGMAHRVVSTLNHINRDTIAWFSQSSIGSITRELADPWKLARERRLGKVLWALVSDRRPPVNAEVSKLIRRFEKDKNGLPGPPEVLSVGLHDLIGSLAPDKSKKGKRAVLALGLALERVAELEAELRNLRREIELLRRQERKATQKNEKLQAQLEQWKAEHGKLTQRLGQLKREAHKQEKAIPPQAGQERREEQTKVAQELRHLRRENKRIAYELEKKGKELAKAQEVILEKQRLQAEVTSLKKESQHLAQERKQEEENLRRRLKEAQEEAQRMREALEKRATPRQPSVKAKGEEVRVGIFADVQNLHHGARKQYGRRIDYERLLNYVVAGRKLVKAIAYLIQPPGTDYSRFIGWLRSLNFEVKSKPPRLRADGSTKSDWDMGVALDIFSLMDKLDVVIILSGDGDFVDLAETLQQKGLKVEVAFFPETTAMNLRETADAYYPLGENILTEIHK